MFPSTVVMFIKMMELKHQSELMVEMWHFCQFEEG